jgi:hypothetical protein
MFDKEKILRLCDEIENAISDAWNSGAIEYELSGHIVSFAKKIAAEITAPPKSNADKIRAMDDEELAEKLRCDSCLYQVMKSECESSDCVHGILAWLRKEVSEDADD